jgi:hypothetical protein
MREKGRPETTAACLLRRASQQGEALAYRFLVDGDCDGEQQTQLSSGSHLRRDSDSLGCSVLTKPERDRPGSKTTPESLYESAAAFA